GYADLIIASDSFILRKKHSVIMPLLKRPISQAEVSEITEHMFSAEMRSYAFEPGHEIDDAYVVDDPSNEELPFRNRVNVCTMNSMKGRGLKITLRDLPVIPPSYEDLNVPEIIRKNAAPVQGLVVICGQTGSGKTTLCASILREMKENNEDPRVILSYERPIEFQFDVISGINPIWQHTIGEFGDFKTFHEGLKNALRCSPESIFLGESREKETFETLPKISESGHHGLTTMHAKSIANIFTRIGNEVDPSQMYGIIRQTLQYMHMGVYQWLAPTVDGKVTPIQEILVFSAELKNELLSLQNEDLIQGINLAVEKYGQPFKQSASKALSEGLITKTTYNMAVLSH
ncbi:ATPase, T2SS/T4P/T4SS family, partial [Vibrio sp. 10N.222.51.A6]